MPEETHFDSIDARCDAKAAYNFVLGTTVKIGHLLALSFPNGGINLVADTEVPDPTDPNTPIKVAGIFDYIAWDGSRTSPITYSLRVSPANKAKIQQAMASKTGGSEMEMEFKICEYGYVDKKYFPHFHSEKKLRGVITKGKKITFSPTSSTDVLQPVNFQVSGSFTVMSEGEKQEVIVAYTADSPSSVEIGATDKG
jgi:hypothetical protein